MHVCWRAHTQARLFKSVPIAKLQFLSSVTPIQNLLHRDMYDYQCNACTVCIPEYQQHPETKATERVIGYRTRLVQFPTRGNLCRDNFTSSTPSSLLPAPPPPAPTPLRYAVSFYLLRDTIHYLPQEGTSPAVYSLTTYRAGTMEQQAAREKDGGTNNVAARRTCCSCQQSLRSWALSELKGRGRLWSRLYKYE